MMRYSVRNRLLWVLAVAFFQTGAAAAGPPIETLVKPCGGCHGPKGVSKAVIMPTIAGIDPEYFVDDMLAFKHGDIASPMMKQFSNYPRETLEAMADYYAGQTYVPQKQKFDAAKAKRGAVLHQQYCEICHRDGGSNEAARERSLPPLAGQGMFYLRNTFADFQKGARPLPDGKQGWLDALFKENGDERLDELLNYYASQQ